MSVLPLDAALGRLPSGIFVLTYLRDGQPAAMLASWIQQAAMNPPMLSVAVERSRPAAEALAAALPFVVNVLGEEQSDLLKHFAKPRPAADAFDGIEQRTSPQGVPRLGTALAWLECQPRGHIESGDHRVYVAEVLAGEVRGEARPMVHIRKSGRHY